ncbi:trimeric intracellular cation channel family protein [Inquilinus sp. CA228]|uniref:trimeric intracellular cation channel family protein n=1 Tax=Inquilinus sp. CA228 TaxID=3455609 RepID=UPI003F8D0A07
MQGQIGLWLDWVGVAVFALTGALVAARRQADPVGFIILATATGIGGGTLRDLLLGIGPVFWIADPVDLVICVVVALTVFFGHPTFPVRAGDGRRRRVIVWADAVGMALFAVTGAERAVDAGAPAVSAIVLGAMTATFGGIIRDVIIGQVTLIVSGEIYVTAAVLGASVYVVVRAISGDALLAACLGAAAAFGLRALALGLGWSLPRFPSDTPKG